MSSHRSELSSWPIRPSSSTTRPWAVVEHVAVSDAQTVLHPVLAPAARQVMGPFDPS